MGNILFEVWRCTKSSILCLNFWFSCFWFASSVE